MAHETCPGCGALYPPMPEAATHRYIGAAAGCWALYTPLTAGQAVDSALVAASQIPPAPESQNRLGAPTVPGVAALFVDAYAAQHHGDGSPPAVQSVAVHLLTLYGVFEANALPEQALWLRRRATRKRGVYHQLAPPPLGHALTIRHLFPGGGVEEPRSVADYVQSVYAIWAAHHHATLVDWYARYILAD